MQMRLVDLIKERSGPLVFPEAIDPLSARLVEQRGYPGIYTGGHGVSALYHGIPDFGLVESGELAAVAERIASSVSVPVLFDADQGGETLLNMRRNVRRFECTGVAAIHLEDTTNPKHLGLGVIGLDEWKRRVATACEARVGDSLAIVARSDYLYFLPKRERSQALDVVIERGRAVAEAGADLFWPVFLAVDDIDLVGREVGIPLVDYNQPVGAVATTSLAIDVIPTYSAFRYLGAAAATLDELERDGRVDFRTSGLPLDQFEGLQDVPGYETELKKMTGA
ncbi:MAG: isocitrate lyase/PEP mutase family protein [Ilumatobacteraceae bacterium]